MRNKIDVYACVGGDVYVKHEVSTAPLSEDEQHKNPLVILNTDEVDTLMERNGSFFVYGQHRNRFVQEHNKDYYQTLRPYRPGYLVALLKDIADAYTAAADWVAEHTDQRAGMKVWIRLSRRVSFGFASTLKAFGIAAHVDSSHVQGEEDSAFANWKKVMVPRLVCAQQVVHFSFDPLSELRQRLAIKMYNIQDCDVVRGNDVLLYHESGHNYTPVITFDNLFPGGRGDGTETIQGFTSADAAAILDDVEGQNDPCDVPLC